MSKFIAFAVLACLPWTAATKTKTVAMRDRAAKELAESFLKYVTKPDDIETVLKICNVPFLLEGKVWKTRNELKDALAPLLREEPAPLNQELSAIYPFAGLPEGVLGEAEHKLYSGILAKTDRIVVLRVERRVIAIAVRGDEAKVRVAGVHVYRNLLPLLMIAHAKEKEDRRLTASRATAKATAAAFMKAMEAKDLDGMMTLAEVPWYSDGTKLVKDRDELKTLLKPRNGGRRPAADALPIVSWGGVRELFPANRREVGDQVFTKDDMIVFLRPQGKRSGVMLFVRVRDGKGKIVGVGE